MRGGRPQGRQDPTQEGLQTHPAELRARMSHQDGIERQQWSACASRLSGYSFRSTPPPPPECASDPFKGREQEDGLPVFPL